MLVEIDVFSSLFTSQNLDLYTGKNGSPKYKNCKIISETYYSSRKMTLFLP